MKNSPSVYASFVSTMWKERNPLKMLLQEITRILKVLVHLKRNMRASQQRIKQLEAQSDRLEQLISENRRNQCGDKLNTMR